MDETSPIKTAVRRRIQWYQFAIVSRHVAGESMEIVRGGQFQSSVAVVVGSQNWLRDFKFQVTVAELKREGGGDWRAISRL
ncbi:UNVERIFIED_CONTAM: hypothetical protein Sindi_2821600 [Sesamum indicum]